METYNIVLSSYEIELVSTCLSSASASCFYNGNTSLATEYSKLREKIYYLIS